MNWAVELPCPHMFQPELETMDPAARKLLQSDRLTGLVDRLKSLDVPYWQKKMAGVGFVTAIDDIAELPFTTKSELRDNYPYGMLTMPIEDCARIHASSGTSGKPTVVAYSREDLRVFADVNARSMAPDRCSISAPDISPCSPIS